MPFGEQAEQRFAGDFGHRVPDRHVDGADGDGPVAVAARLFVAHHGGPDFVGVQVVAGLIQQGGWFGLEDTGGELFPDQSALAVAAVGVEAVADHGLAVALDVGDHGDEAGGHLGKIDVGVADRGTDRLGDLADIDNTQGHDTDSLEGADDDHDDDHDHQDRRDFVGYAVEFLAAAVGVVEEILAPA